MSDRPQETAQPMARPAFQADPKAVEAYERRLDEMKNKATAGDTNAVEALRVSELLNEPNALGVYRLIHIFGRQLVAQKAEEALNAHRDGVGRAAEVYVRSENGTLLATRGGRARTPGGVFFYLIRQHCESIGLNLDSLYIPTVPQFPRPTQNKRPPPRPAQPPRSEAAVPPEPAPAKQAQVDPIAVPNPEPKAEVAPVVRPEARPEGKDKPGRATLKITGTLSGSPKDRPQNRDGLLELVFEVEMNQSLPKGLPSLGASKVVVWCTQKQYDRVKASVTPQTRFLIEGEPAAAVTADFKPFLRLICLKLSTVELEQVARQTSPQPG